MPSTIDLKTVANVKILRSEFIATIYPCSTSQDAQLLLREHNVLYSNATHNCYAYIFGINKDTQYYSDAGEPSGTAGKPILNSLLRNDLSGILAVVTRYYGGIKLGVKGLIDAYSEATELAIMAANKLPLLMYKRFSISVDYSLLDHLRHHIHSINGKEVGCEYTSRVVLQVDITEDSMDDFEKMLLLLKTQNRLEYLIED